MDVQVLEMSNGLHDLSGIPGIRRRRPDPTPTHAASPDGAGPGTATRQRPWLHAYTAISIIAGLGALIWTTQAVPIVSDIDPHLAGTALGGSDGGMLLWIAFGLIGSLRVLPIPGSSGVWTFHLPFIAAAMVLGGPTAGAWVGFLSTFERRELESQPWYGALANHSVMAFAAVLGGLTVQITHGALVSVGVDSGLASLAAIAIGTLVLAVAGNGIAAGTIMLREGLSPVSLIELLVRSFGGITLAEIGLAWVFVTVFDTTGWWAPLALAVIVLLVWPRDGAEFADPLTKLQRAVAFHRELDGVLTRTRRGLAPGGLLLSIDLDGFGAINREVGHAVADEVLVEIGNRIRAQIRATDFAGRLGGDEFGIFYAGVVDLATAQRVAERLQTAIRRPVATSTGTQTVGVSIGAVIVPPTGDIPARATLMHWADRVMQAQKRAQKERGVRTSIRFHEYGSAAKEADENPTPAEAGREPGTRGRPRIVEYATRVTVLMFIVVLTAWTLSRVIPA